MRYIRPQAAKMITSTNGEPTLNSASTKTTPLTAQVVGTSCGRGICTSGSITCGSEPNGVNRFRHLRTDAVLDEDPVPGEEHEQRPDLAPIVVRPRAVRIEQPQRGLAVDQVVRLRLR